MTREVRMVIVVNSFEITQVPQAQTIAFGMQISGTSIDGVGEMLPSGCNCFHCFPCVGHWNPGPGGVVRTRRCPPKHPSSVFIAK